MCTYQMYTGRCWALEVKIFAAEGASLHKSHLYLCSNCASRIAVKFSGWEASVQNGRINANCRLVFMQSQCIPVQSWGIRAVQIGGINIIAVRAIQWNYSGRDWWNQRPHWALLCPHKGPTLANCYNLEHKCCPVAMFTKIYALLDKARPYSSVMFTRRYTVGCSEVKWGS